MSEAERDLLRARAMLSHAIGMVATLQGQYLAAMEKVKEVEELARRLERVVSHWEVRMLEEAC